MDAGLLKKNEWYYLSKDIEIKSSKDKSFRMFFPEGSKVIFTSKATVGQERFFTFHAGAYGIALSMTESGVNENINDDLAFTTNRDKA